MNLLSNAIKFTESGSIGVDVKELADNRIEIAVWDTGIGIASSDLQYIFEAFRQLDQSITRKYPGTGLGLPIVDALVQMMGGKISVESELGQGSVFRIELPRHISSKQQNQDRMSKLTHLSSTSKKHLAKQQDNLRFAQEGMQGLPRERGDR
jgi:signal transduction histidine kinase